MFRTAVLLIVCALALASDVVVLTSANFEKETQATTGATTGDWLVKFYAPWCGHCKTLAPVYEEVATKLKGQVNVAKVDVTANRDIGTQFEIKGFPTVKFLSKGNVYDFKGRRTVADLVAFATEGYALAEPVPVPEPKGMFGELTTAFKQAFEKAQKDIKKGNYFTPDIMLCSMPFIFVLLMLAVIAVPFSDPSLQPKKSKKAE